MPVLKSRKTTSYDSSKERLRKAAVKLFSRKGFDRVSVRDIVRESCCNVSLISYYFGGKEKLYLSLFEDFFRRLEEHFETTYGQATTGRDWSRQVFEDNVRNQIVGVIEQFLKEPEMRVLLHREVMEGFPHTRKLVDRHVQKIKPGLLSFYQRAAESGFLKSSIHLPTFSLLLNRSIEAYLVAFLVAKPMRDFGIDPIKDTALFVNQVQEIFLRGVLA